MSTPTAPGQDEVAVLARHFRETLAQLYRDPRAAERAFHAEVGRHGIDGAAARLARQPETLGTLRELRPDQAGQIATAASRDGAIAYQRLLAGTERSAAVQPSQPQDLARHPLIREAAHECRSADRVEKLVAGSSSTKQQVLDARGTLRQLDAQEQASRVAQTRFRTEAARIWKDPGGATEKFLTAATKNPDAATKALAQDPQQFGALRNPVRQGHRHEPTPKQLAPRMNEPARQLLDTRAALAKPVQWTHPTTKRVFEGREAVREAAGSLVQHHTRRLTNRKSMIGRRGGLTGSRFRAGMAMHRAAQQFGIKAATTALKTIPYVGKAVQAAEILVKTAQQVQQAATMARGIGDPA